MKTLYRPHTAVALAALLLAGAAGSASANEMMADRTQFLGVVEAAPSLRAEVGVPSTTASVGGTDVNRPVAPSMVPAADAWWLLREPIRESADR